MSTRRELKPSGHKVHTRTTLSDRHESISYTIQLHISAVLHVLHTHKKNTFYTTASGMYLEAISKLSRALPKKNVLEGTFTSSALVKYLASSIIMLTGSMIAY